MSRSNAIFSPAADYWTRDIQSVDRPSPKVDEDRPFWRLDPSVLNEKGKVIKGGFFPKQRQWWDLNTFVRGLIGGYGSGKTFCLCKRLIALALQNTGCMVAAVSPTFPLASKTLIPTLEALLAGKQTILGKSFWWRHNKSSHEFYIRYKGRSGWIKVMSGEDPRSLRGPNIAAAGLDEPFLMDVEVLRQMIARIRHPDAVVKELDLSGCIARDSWVTTKQGMVRIGDLDPGTKPKQYASLNCELLGIHNDFHSSSKFYNNGLDETVIIKLTNGYELEGTPDHPVLVMGNDGVPKFKRLGDRRKKYAELEQLQLGDRVAISRGADVWGNVDPLKGFIPDASLKCRKILSRCINGMTDDLAYFMGLWLAEGNIDGRYRLGITCGDPAVIKSLCEVGVLGLRFKNKPPFRCQVNSKRLVDLMNYVGTPLTTAPHKYIPQWVFSGKREWALQFLAGMFDGDGHVCKDGQGIGYSTTSLRLAKDLQCMLLNLGIVSHRDSVWNKPTEKSKVWSLAHHVKVNCANASKLAKLLPLRIGRKKRQLEIYKREMRDSDKLPCQSDLILNAWNQRQKLRWRKGASRLEPNKIIETIKKHSGAIAYSTLQDFVSRWRANEIFVPDEIRQLEQNLADGYYWAEVKSLTRSEAETVDFVIPETHSFVSNGLVSRNTPESLNWGYDLFMGDMKEEFENVNTTIGLVQISSRDNLATGGDYIKRLEGAFTEKAAEAYIEGGFVNLSKGQVYYAFQSIGPDSNIRDLPIPDNAELGCGMDFNVNPMSASLFWRQGDHMHFFDEIELPNADTELLCDDLYRKYVGQERKTKQQLHYIYPDASGSARHTSAPAGKTDFHFIREAGFTIRAHDANPKQKDRYNAANGKFKAANGKTTLTVSPKCKRLIRYLLTYTHELKNKPEQKAFSHLLDSFCYPIEFLYPCKPEIMLQTRLIGH